VLCCVVGVGSACVLFSMVAISGGSSLATTASATIVSDSTTKWVYRLRWLLFIAISLACVYGLHLAFLRLPRLLSVSNRINEMMNERHIADAAALALQEEWETLSCEVKALYSREQKLINRIEHQSSLQTESRTILDVSANTTANENPPLRVFIAIMSGFMNKDTRQLIRETWASDSFINDNKVSNLSVLLL